MKKRVTIPARNVSEMLSLIKKVQAKHTTDGDKSVLKILNWTTLNQVISEASAATDRADRLKRELREAFQLRDAKTEVIVNALRCCRDILSGVHNNEMKVLGQWGFEVLETRSVKKADDNAMALKIAS